MRAYFISLENIDEVGSFKTGMSINVIHDEKISAANLHSLPREMMADEQITNTGELIEYTEENLLFYKFQYEVSFPTYDGTVYNMLVANKSINTLYIISFESPSIEWDEAWKTGQVLIEKMKFLEIK